MAKIHAKGRARKMNVIKIENAFRISYTAQILNSARQNWTSGYVFSCIGEPKKQHHMLYLINCRAVYTLKDGREIAAPKNSVVYTPEGCEYSVRFVDCETAAGYNSVAVNFKLYDESGEPFCFDSGVKVYSVGHGNSVSESFHRIAEESRRAAVSPMKIAGLFYILLSDIGSFYHTKHNVLPKYNVIAKGINMLESTSVSDIRIDDIAAACNVSAIYFRRLFKEYSGMTPIDYKLSAMIDQAKRHLVYSERSVAEIAEMLGFSSTTYFCRLFKRKTGMTPMEFARSNGDENEKSR